MARQPAKDYSTGLRPNQASKSPNNVDTCNPLEVFSTQAALLAHEEVSCEAPGVLILEAPGTPSKAEGDRSDMTGLSKFELNSQSIAGLVFFYAWKVFKDREAAMALALCLEAALYWHLHAPDKQPLPKLAEQQHLPDPVGNGSTPEPAGSGQIGAEHPGGAAEHGSVEVEVLDQYTSRPQPSKGSSDRVSGGSIGRARSQSRDKATANGMQQDRISPVEQAVRPEPSMTSASIATPQSERAPAESNGVAGRPEQGLHADVKVSDSSAGGSAVQERLGERPAASALAGPNVHQPAGEPSTSVARSLSQPGSKAREASWAYETAKGDVRHMSEEGIRGHPRSEGAGVIPKPQQEEAVARSRGRPPKSQSLAGKSAALVVGNGVSSQREASTGSQSTAKRKGDLGGQIAMKRLKTESGIENGLWKKRQETFSPKKLQPGMAVLLRTEPDDAGQWNKVWSLGRVIRVNLPKGTIDVTWLKPERLVSGAGMWEQPWLPWLLPQVRGSKGAACVWQSRGLDLASVQWGMPLPASGYIPPAERTTLAAEVARLEAAPRVEEVDTNLNFSALRKNSIPLASSTT